MYKNYEQTCVRNKRQALDTTKFLLEVREVACALWKIDVGPYRGEGKIRVVHGKKLDRHPLKCP